MAVDSGGQSSTLAGVEQDSFSNAEQKVRKRGRGGQSRLFGISATAFESRGEGLAPRKPADKVTVQPSVSTWMRSNAAATRAPDIQLQTMRANAPTRQTLPPIPHASLGAQPQVS